MRLDIYASLVVRHSVEVKKHWEREPNRVADVLIYTHTHKAFLSEGVEQGEVVFVEPRRSFAAPQALQAIAT